MDTANMDVQFQCNGSFFNDDLLFYQFNTTVQLANPSMQDKSREKEYIKLDPSETKLFNYYGYPRINPITSELEWWVRKEDYVHAAQRLEALPEPATDIAKQNRKEINRIGQNVNFDTIVSKLR